MIKKIKDTLLGEKVSGVRITPSITKILLVFVIFIIVANFSTNYLNLKYNQTVMTRLLKQLLVKDLKEIYNFCNNQYEIYEDTKNIEKAYVAISKKGFSLLGQKNSIILGIKESGDIVFQSSKIGSDTFREMQSLKLEVDETGYKSGAGKVEFNYLSKNYFGIYKFHPKWNIFILRAEDKKEFYAESNSIFRKISLIIFFLTLLCAGIGLVVIRELLKFIHIITSSLMAMNKEQKISRINLANAPIDEITYLGMSFNALGGTIGNLLDIFRKFVSNDLVEKIYKEKNVRLEGTKKDLAILFTDIKQFTFITETLGTDIIQLLNIHYDKAIQSIVKEQGIVGSIIGDALLAVYGTFDESRSNKSFQAVTSAYQIIDCTVKLRDKMKRRRDELLSKNGQLTEKEEKIYQAVSLDVGVGIDRGEVFYGNIGSYQQMTSTVIGDRVNSSSRLEGLTRIYKVPVIISESVKEEIEHSVLNHDIVFVEVDLVQVKGKTHGRRIYWPIFKSEITEEMEKDIANFKYALDFYYAGHWVKAHKEFKSINLPIVEEFINRTKEKAPTNWSGIWKMTTK